MSSSSSAFLHTLHTASSWGFPSGLQHPLSSRACRSGQPPTDKGASKDILRTTKQSPYQPEGRAPNSLIRPDILDLSQQTEEAALNSSLQLWPAGPEGGEEPGSLPGLFSTHSGVHMHSRLGLPALLLLCGSPAGVREAECRWLINQSLQLQTPSLRVFPVDVSCSWPSPQCCHTHPPPRTTCVALSSHALPAPGIQMLDQLPSLV